MMRHISFLFRVIQLLVLFQHVQGAATSCGSGGGGSSTSYDFDRMSSLIQRLDTLGQSAADTLFAFYEPELKTFSVTPGTPRRNGVGVLDTCYALLTMTSDSAGSMYDSVLSYENNVTDHHPTDPYRYIPIPAVMQTLLMSEWREDDRFQVPLLLYTILFVNPSVLNWDEEETATKIRQLISLVLAARPHRRLAGRQQNSDYISYQVCKVVGLLQECQMRRRAELPQQALPENIGSDLFNTLQRCYELSLNELCRQLAYRAADDFNSFDVIRLVYSLLTYIRGTQSLVGISGKEISPGEGPSTESKVAPLNQKLVKAALAAFFEEQNHDGLWDKGQPIYKSFKKGKDRTMDNAFVFPVNTVGSLLCALPAEDFRPHLAALERTLAWIEGHQTVEMITTHSDPTSGLCYGTPLSGWSSPHHEPDAGPRAWPTAQVLKCVAFMRRTISQLMHNDVLKEFQGKSFSREGIQPESWDKLLDSDLGNPHQDEECRTIKSVLEERVVKPFSESIDSPSYGAAYSAILFGPPGTAKTTICEALAKRMGYDFCVIDTTAFLADGLTNVAARIRYVFKRLMALQKCIILFDEIEEFCLDRENPGLSMESRMLTTAMLTAINDLRHKKKSIFFIATNRLRAFDSAITRPGRFDMQLFVGTPNLQSRVIQFRQQLQKSAVSSAGHTKRINQAIESFRNFLESNWSKDAKFMNFLEGRQFASACAAVIKDGETNLRPELLTEETMSTILQQQAAVMTVRGSARDEFISSIDMSRF